MVVSALFLHLYVLVSWVLMYKRTLAYAYAGVVAPLMWIPSGLSRELFSLVSRVHGFVFYILLSQQTLEAGKINECPMLWGLGESVRPREEALSR